MLPVPDIAAAAISGRLADLIRAEIGEQQGFIPFSRYMELALYAPGLGYYTAGSHKLGEGGDLVTAPLTQRLVTHDVLDSECNG